MVSPDVRLLDNPVRGRGADTTCRTLIVRGRYHHLSTKCLLTEASEHTRTIKTGFDVKFKLLRRETSNFAGQTKPVCEPYGISLTDRIGNRRSHALLTQSHRPPKTADRLSLRFSCKQIFTRNTEPSEKLGRVTARRYNCAYSGLFGRAARGWSEAGCKSLLEGELNGGSQRPISTP
jgi:hypothetical protein